MDEYCIKYENKEAGGGSGDGALIAGGGNGYGDGDGEANEYDADGLEGTGLSLEASSQGEANEEYDLFKK